MPPPRHLAIPSDALLLAVNGPEHASIEEWFSTAVPQSQLISSCHDAESLLYEFVRLFRRRNAKLALPGPGNKSHLHDGVPADLHQPQERTALPASTLASRLSSDRRKAEAVLFVETKLYTVHLAFEVRKLDGGLVKFALARRLGHRNLIGGLALRLFKRPPGLVLKQTHLVRALPYAKGRNRPEI